MAFAVGALCCPAGSAPPGVETPANLKWDMREPVPTWLHAPVGWGSAGSTGLLRVPAHDAGQLTGEFTRRANGFVNAPGEGGVVPVLSADDDAPVIRQRAVESHRAISVVRFVLLDFPVYLLRVPLHIAPGIEQIGGLERGVVAQDFLVAGPEAAP